MSVEAKSDLESKVRSVAVRAPSFPVYTVAFVSADKGQLKWMGVYRSREEANRVALIEIVDRVSRRDENDVPVWLSKEIIVKLASEVLRQISETQIPKGIPLEELGASLNWISESLIRKAVETVPLEELDELVSKSYLWTERWRDWRVVVEMQMLQ